MLVRNHLKICLLACAFSFAILFLNNFGYAQGVGIGKLATKVDGFNQQTLLYLNALQQDRSANSMRQQAVIKFAMAMELYEEADDLDDDPDCKCGDDARRWGDMLAMQAMQLQNTANSLEANAKKSAEAADNLGEDAAGGGGGGGSAGATDGQSGQAGSIKSPRRDNDRKSSSDKGGVVAGTNNGSGTPNSGSSAQQAALDAALAKNQNLRTRVDLQAGEPVVGSGGAADATANADAPNATINTLEETDIPAAGEEVGGTVADVPDQNFDAEEYGNDYDFGGEGGGATALTEAAEGENADLIASAGTGGSDNDELAAEAENALKNGGGLSLSSDSATEYAGGGQGLGSGGGSKKSSGMSKSLIERAKAMLGKGQADGKGGLVNRIPGSVVFGKDANGKPVLKYVVKSKTGGRDLMSSDKYVNINLFKRVSSRYRVHMPMLLSYDWYLNDRLKKDKKKY